MDVWRLLSGALRRWYVLAGMLAMTALAVAFSPNLVDPEYQASAYVNIVPSTAPIGVADEETRVENPLAGLDTAAIVLKYALNSSATQSDIARQGLSADYEIGTVPNSAILGISVRATTAEGAIRTATALVAAAEQELDDRQRASGLPPSQFFGIDILDEPDAATASIDGTLKAAAAILFVGVVSSFLVAVLVDDVLILRRRLPEDDAVTAASPTVPTTPEDQEETRTPASMNSGVPLVHAAVASDRANGSTPSGQRPESRPSSEEH